MTGAPASPPPPPPPPGVHRAAFDGSFTGPLAPPPSPPPPRDPATDAVLAIPLGTRKLVAMALDLLTRQDSGLRSASFYIGLIVLVTIGPLVLLVAVAATLGVQLFDPFEPSSLDGPIFVTSFLALAGYVVAGIESRALAVAVIGGRAEGRPMRLRESVAIARRRFWVVFGANVLVGLVAGLVSLAVQLPIGLLLGNVEAINYGLGLVIGTLVAVPFVYVPPAIILGEVGPMEAIRRSIRLARARLRLALVVAMFSIVSQFIVLFGISIGGDVVVRIYDGTGITEVPAVLAILVAAALTFAFGTLLFLVEAITTAPAVYAFEALTHYTHGLEAGRERPAGGRWPWNPWFTRGLLAATALGLVCLVAGFAGVA